MARPALSYDHGTGTEKLIYQTIGDLLKQTAARFPDHDALVDCNSAVRFTYSAFDRLTDDLAKGMHALGIKRGDRVGIWSINRWEWVATQFATAKIGAIMVNINPAYRTHELEYALQQSETQTVILLEAFKTSAYLEMMFSICPELATARPGAVDSTVLPYLKNVILFGGTHPATFDFNDLLEQGKAIADDELIRIMGELDPDDDVNIQYTSGTTGFPKGVVLSHFNIVNNAFLVANVMRFTEADRLCIPVPFYHCFGMVLSNMACVTAGAAMIVPGPMFDPVTVFEAVEKEHCTALHGVPTMFIAELNHPDFGKYDRSNLRTGIMAGSPCPIETMRTVIDRMNMTDVVIAYGMTETSPVTIMTRIEDTIERRVSTVGRAMTTQEVKVISTDNGATLSRGEQGELCFRGYSVMKRYYNNPEATAETIDEAGWLHSGDLGVMDADGYVKITGRIKEMVIRGGENLYPREIEEFLRTHTDIMDVYVVGVPDIKYGEELMAWVLPKSGRPLDVDTLRAFCESKISRHKVPRYWKFVNALEDIPMTITGKIQKFKMREIAISELGLEEAANVKTA
jgi:fatty-acyl-CoA synthase